MTLSTGDTTDGHNFCIAQNVFQKILKFNDIVREIEVTESAIQRREKQKLIKFTECGGIIKEIYDEAKEAWNLIPEPPKKPSWKKYVDDFFEATEIFETFSATGDFQVKLL